MALMAIWVDRENAKLFHFGSEQLTHKNFVARYPMHHTHAEGEVDHQRREHEFFKEFTPEMKDADQILIMGPGVAKHHFQTFLNEHHPAIAKKIVGCEAVDHPTEPQIIALARRFFSTEHFPT